MKLTMMVNNYILGIIHKQLQHYVIEETKKDQWHTSVEFRVNNKNDIMLIQKITTYNGIITEQNVRFKGSYNRIKEIFYGKLKGVNMEIFIVEITIRKIAL